MGEDSKLEMRGPFAGASRKLVKYLEFEVDGWASQILSCKAMG